MYIDKREGGNGRFRGREGGMLEWKEGQEGEVVGRKDSEEGEREGVNGMRDSEEGGRGSKEGTLCGR